MTARDLREELDALEFSVTEDRRRVRGDGASSSSLQSNTNQTPRVSTLLKKHTDLSLQPRPVVNPIPPRNNLPSRWRCLRLTVSR